MAERSKQSMLIHVVAIAFIMGRLIIREKTGFGLIVAIAIADAVLFSAVLDYDNSTAWASFLPFSEASRLFALLRLFNARFTNQQRFRQLHARSSWAGQNRFTQFYRT